MKPPLTKREHQVYDYIISFNRKHQHVPPLEQIASKFERTKSWAQQIVQSLERKEWLKFERRSFRVLV